MKAGPILMSTPMVQASLAGRKTKTRRVVKGIALDWLDGAKFDPEFVTHPENDICPFGKIGDLLYVRENFCVDSLGDFFTEINYLADNKTMEFPAQPYSGITKKCGNKPSIHMPRWASRLTLEITDIRVERLQDISEEDAIAEGCESTATLTSDGLDYTGLYAQEHFSHLWQSIYGEESWDSNPWVWCVSFKVHNCNVDEFIKAQGVQNEK